MSKNAPPSVEEPQSSFRARIRYAIGCVALALVGICLALGAGELVARIAFEPMRSVSWYHYDLRYGFRHRDNANALTNIWGDAAEWRFRTNSRGFRGSEWPDIPSDNVNRVLVTGDSFTFGNGLDEESAYPRVAQTALGAGSGWEVLNLGVSAWGPQNALAYLETEGASIQASCLVYGFFEGNDVMDGVVRGLYKLEGGIVKPIAITAPPPSRLASVRKVLIRLPLYDFLLEHSQLFNVARTTFINVLTRHDQTAPAQELYSASNQQSFEHAQKPNGAAPDRRTTDIGANNSWQDALKLNDATMDRLLALARSRYGAFVLVLIPMRGQVAPDKDPMALPFPLWMAQDSHARALGWAKARNVPVVDMADLLPKTSGEVARYYFKRDFHLNSEGNKLLGKALGDRLHATCANQVAAAP